MPGPLRIAVVNAAYDPSVASPEALLDRYETLTAWCRALVNAGAEVRVAQRFSRTATFQRDHIIHHFARDPGPPVLGLGSSAPALVAAVARLSPDVVHVNGLMFPGLVRALRKALTPAVAIVVQDHAGAVPPAGATPTALWRRRQWRRGLAEADAVSFTAEEQAMPWRTAGLIGTQVVLAVLESSTTVQPTTRADARASTGLSGNPLFLWVGRLVENKGPLTVLAGFEHAAAHLPEARLAMVYRDGELAAEVAERVAASTRLRSMVSLVGPVSHDAIGAYYGAADAFISGSRSEGSGYALIESMACGLVPVVTDIPPFRAITGPCGLRWPPDDVGACGAAIRNLATSDARNGGPAAAERFRRELSWNAVGERTLAAYRDLSASRLAHGVA